MPICRSVKEMGSVSSLAVCVHDWIISSDCRCWCGWSCIRDSASNPILTHLPSPGYLG